MARPAHERAAARASIAAKARRSAYAPPAPPDPQAPRGRLLSVHLYESDVRYAAGLLGSLIRDGSILAWPRIAERVRMACVDALVPIDIKERR